MKQYSYILAMLIAFAMVACTQNQKNEEAHPHDEKLQLTAYSQDFEVFAEATPFVVGQTSDILAHFSFLNNFKPLTKGEVVVSLIIESEGIRQTLTEPTRPGIFKFSLQPVKAGTGKLVFDISSDQIKSQIVIPNIKVYSDAHEAQHAVPANTASNSTAVFTKEQSWKVDFATEQVHKEAFGQIIRTTGQIQPSLGDELIITAKASGIVHLSGNDIVEGKSVSSGQSLFSIDGSGMADNNLSVRFMEAQSEYTRAKAEYERKSELAKDNIVSQSELLKSKTDFSNAEANYNNLKRNFSSGIQNMRSQKSGFISRVFVRNGQFVQAGQPVLEVSQNLNLFIKAEIQPKYADILGSITSVNFKVLNNNQTYSLKELDGKILSYGKSVDMSNPLIPVVFLVTNKVGFIPGGFLEMFIRTETNTQAITVPNEAIIEEMGNYFIYVQLTPESFDKRVVKTGGTDGIRTEITEGVIEGERIVSKGAILVKLAQASGAVDAHAGHVH
mgnify:CR=1 FL=1